MIISLTGNCFLLQSKFMSSKNKFLQSKQIIDVKVVDLKPIDLINAV